MADVAALKSYTSIALLAAAAQAVSRASTHRTANGAPLTIATVSALVGGLKPSARLRVAKRMAFHNLLHHWR